MTAKEMIKFIKGGKEFTEHSVILLNPDFLNEILTQICKEQREICGEEVSISDTPTKIRVLNASMPEI